MSGNCGPKADSEFDTLERCRKFLINHLYKLARNTKEGHPEERPLNTYCVLIHSTGSNCGHVGSPLRPAGELAMGGFRKGELPAKAVARWHLPISLQALWQAGAELTILLCNTAVSLSDWQRAAGGPGPATVTT